MPVSNYINVKIDGGSCDIGKPQDLGFRYSYGLEDPENFQDKQGGYSLNITMPATPNNDRIFNQFHNQNVEDLTADSIYSNYRSCQIIVDGVELLTGCAILQNASHTRIPDAYMLSAYNQNSDWVVQARDLTLWDCLSDTPHTFDVATVQASWDNFDSDEDHDFVYAPVRYRQPFGVNDDTVNIYHLRPSISIYWLLFRGFRLLGIRMDTQFLNTLQYFRRFVMPWTWGDFYDIDNQIIDSFKFTAAGDIEDMTLNEPPSGAPTTIDFWTGTNSGLTTGSPHGSDWKQRGFTLAGSGYIFSDGANNHFKIDNVLPPVGTDNLGIYSMQEFAGTYPAGSMIMKMNLPTIYAPYISTNLTIAFSLSLYVQIECGNHCSIDLLLEITHIPVTGPTVVTTNSILPGGAPIGSFGQYPNTTGYPTTPTVYNFTVPNMNQGDVLQFRLKYNQSGVDPGNLTVAQAGYLNTNPSILGMSNWQYNPVTQKFGYIPSVTAWQGVYSTLAMTGFQLQVGGTVNFKNYDKFRSYKFLDLLMGNIDMFNLSLQTNPVARVVTIEPTHDYVLPDGTVMPGFFKKERIDWTLKQDVSKPNVMDLYSDGERQFDFSFKGDGADGAQNIYTARYKGIYLNNKVINQHGNNYVENGTVSAIPGSSRYQLPNRFQTGIRSQVNRFFSAVIHYNHTKWAKINELLGGAPADNHAPQLVCIIPENINDSSASAVTQTFEPKLAYYAGRQPINAVGGWRWIGDPASLYTDGGTPNAIGFELPYMFAVDYSGYVGTAPGTMAPVLSYCNQNINGMVKAGLMKTFFLKRMATIRNGKLYRPYMQLNLSDITDWTHRNSVIINGATYHLIGIDNYDPLNGGSCQCTLWKTASPEEKDIDNSFPSDTSILTSPAILPQFDLKYAQLLILYTDIPQIG